MLAIARGPRAARRRRLDDAAGSAPYLAARGIEAGARGCRQLSKGVDLPAARRRTCTLPTVAVPALGSNGTISGAQIERALRLIGRGACSGS